MMGDIDLFDKTAPLGGLVNFMKGLYDAQTVNMKNELPEGITREHAFVAALHNSVSDELAEYIKSSNIIVSER